MAKSFGEQFEDALKKGDTNKANWLINFLSGDDLDEALRWGCQSGHLDVVKKLIEKGANVNQKYDYAKTALMKASEAGYLEIVKKLIEKGVDINQKDYYDRTALMYASQEGHVEVVKELIKSSADVNQKDNYGSTAIAVAKNEEVRRGIIGAVKEKNKETSFLDKLRRGLRIGE